MNRFMRNISIIVFVVLIQNFVSAENVEDYANSISKPELVVYKAPNGAPENSTFSVFVKYDGGNWIDLHEYDAGVDGGHFKEALGHMSFVSFDSDFSKKIVVRIVVNRGEVKDVKIRPSISGVKHNVTGNSIMFTLDSPKKTFCRGKW